MKQERQSNFELLRIILMIAIPIYHLMVYSGMNNQPYNELTIPSLLLCSGSAIVADYAFMAMSSYFYLDMSAKRVDISRFKRTLFQVAFIFVIKYTVLLGCLKFDMDNTFYQSFFFKGSWWFIGVYLIITLIYPILNNLVFSTKITHLRILCMIFGGWFIYCGITYHDNLINDILAFVFVYLIVGYLKRNNFRSFFALKNNKLMMFGIYLSLYLFTFGSCLYVKLSNHIWDAETSGDIVRQIVGKYSFPQLIMGIAVFLLFRSIKIPTNKKINHFARNTFYVFLLHETVMAIFWHFDKLIIVDGILPFENVGILLLWCGIYLLSSFGFAIVVRWFYERMIKVVLYKIFKEKGE